MASRIDHRKVRKLIEDRKSAIRDDELFVSRLMCGHFEDIDAASMGVYGIRRRVRVVIRWMEDNGFVTSFFNIKVKSIDGDINTTYYDYLKTKQKQNIWFIPFYWIKEQFKEKDNSKGNGDGEFDPYRLSRKDDEIAEAIRSNIKLSIDKKTGEITINTKAQDPLICKTIADSVRSRLQEFITDYRTNKARSD